MIRSFFATPQPYRTDFTLRMLFRSVPSLAAAHKAWLRRPWLPPAESNSAAMDLKPGCHIGAVPHYRTGIGHSLAEWNTGLLWSQKLGIPFAHCPLREPWNGFLGLTGFTDFQELVRRGYRVIRLPSIPNDENPAESPLIRKIIAHYGRRGPTLFQLYFDQNAFRQHETSSILRQKYFDRRMTDPRPNVRDERCINVAVHVRRPTAEDLRNPKYNDPNSAEHKARYLDSDVFLRICRIIEAALGRERTRFHIFSLGEDRDFREFDVLHRKTLHLNTDALDTFHQFVTSDILIVSPSSFSFKAGMIAPGLKIARAPWWHEIPDDAEWCRISSDARAEEARLAEFVRGVRPPSFS